MRQFEGFTERWQELQDEFAATATIPKISMRTVYGHDDPITAIDQARNLAERKQVLVLIGPSQSSIAATVIEIYKDSGKPLLLLATNPELTEGNYPNVKTVFRLPPTDRAQVDTLVDLFAPERRPTTQFPNPDPPLGGQPRTLAILRDHSNQKYTEYIAVTVRKELEERIQLDNCAPCPRIVVYGVVGAPGATMHVTQTMTSVRPDDLLFIGSRATALTLIEQAHSLGWSPRIFVTEASVGNGFLKLGGDNVEGVYATFPADDQASFQSYGSDAVSILAKLRSDIQAKGHFGILWRDFWGLLSEDLAEKLDKTRDLGVLAKDLINEYSFNLDGDNTAVRFHIWQVTNGQWTRPPIY